MSLKHTVIETERFDKSILKNTFWYQEKTSEKLAIIFPGAGYSCMGPILYYTVNLLIENGFDVLMVEYDFRYHPKVEERKDFLLHDIKQAYAKIQDRYREYKKCLLVSKSVGTRGISWALEQDVFAKSKMDFGMIWMTPAWNDPSLFKIMTECQYPGMHIMGTKDPAYTQQRAETFKGFPDQTLLEIEGADHSVDVASGVMDTLDSHKSMIQAIQSWLLNLGFIA